LEDLKQSQSNANSRNLGKRRAKNKWKRRKKFVKEALGMNLHGGGEARKRSTGSLGVVLRVGSKKNNQSQQVADSDVHTA